MATHRAATGRVAILIALACLGTCALTAQTSVFNIPSADTLEKKSTYVEADYYGHFDSYENGGFHQFGPTVVYGLTDDLEIGANLLYLKDINRPGVELQPNIKWRFYQNKKAGVNAAAGTILFVPLTKAAGSAPSAMFYASVSKSFKDGQGTKLTGGIYTSAGSRDDIRTRTGVMLGLDQPITDKVFLMADWASGNNRLGYASLGLGYQTAKNQYIAAGYSIGNSSRANNYFTAIYAVTF